MFSNLIKSEARKSILHLLTQNSRQKYYLRELASIISYSPGSLQRELNTLVESGFVVSEKMGNLRFFSLNTKSPFLAELKRYLGQHNMGQKEHQIANESGTEGTEIRRKTSKSSTKQKEKRPVLDRRTPENLTNLTVEKQDILNKNQQPPPHPTTHSTIQATTQMDTPATPSISSVPLIPSTPFSHIEPPTFSRPVLHKPHLEKPSFTAPHLASQSSLQSQNPQHFDIVEPPSEKKRPTIGNSDIEIHIE